MDEGIPIGRDPVFSLSIPARTSGLDVFQTGFNADRSQYAQSRVGTSKDGSCEGFNGSSSRLKWGREVSWYVEEHQAYSYLGKQHARDVELGTRIFPHLLTSRYRDTCTSRVDVPIGEGEIRCF